MLWQAVTSIAALVAALAGLGLGVTTAVRAGRDAEARERAEDAQRQASATEVGLKALQQALDRQQDELKEQRGYIGQLTAKLDECRREREALHATLIDHERTIATQTRRIEELERQVSG